MSLKVLTLFAILAIQHIGCATVQEIRSQFEPTLIRLRDLANVKYQEAERERVALVGQLNNHQTRTKNSTQTQINNIRKVISDAKKSPNVTNTVLSCLRSQETAANSLNTVSLNQCLTSTNTSALINSRYKFSRLATVASNTNSWCLSLNPLDTQVESYARCLADKVPDLNRQINIVEREYQAVSNSTLNYNIRCLTENVGNILGKISLISYQVNVCFLAPL